MRRGNLLARRRHLRREAPKSDLSSCEPAPIDLQPARESLVIMVVAFLVSLGLHGGMVVATAGAASNRLHTETVMTITNDRAEDDSAQEESGPEENERLAEDQILEPDPDEFGSVGASGPAERILDESTETPPDELDEQFPDIADQGPPEEVFGVDFSATIDRGAIAVRVGNSLGMRPGKFVDPHKVRSLDYTPEYAELEPEPAPDLSVDLEMPEAPHLEMPEPPRPEPVEKPRISVKKKKRRKVKRTVPKDKYRNRVVPEYTEDAIDAEIEGVVTVDVWVDRNGVVKKAEIVKGLGYGLDQRVTEAARKSTFNPILADGKPSACKYRLNYRFQVEW